jgi:hypothetical protein
MAREASPGPRTAPGTAASPSGPPLVLSRQSLFAIPFRIDRPDRISNEPLEVQLYVSGDRGGHWDLYRKTSPARGRFLFRAGTDGEYWFTVRTLDRSGRVRPEGPYVPELKVFVDTRPAAAPPAGPSAAPPGGGSVMSFPPADRNPAGMSLERPAAIPVSTGALGPPQRAAEAPTSGLSARITSCQQGLGSDADKLTITWEVDEGSRLASRPITLCCSETLGGPWTTLAGSLENTGRYTWASSSPFPARIFLRLEVRDEAGNIHPFETREPVALSGR